jgi:hypothetical protein
MEHRRFACPTCGFLIYNRRNAQCEFCDGDLPVELLFTVGEIRALDEAHARSRRERAVCEAKEYRQAKRRKRWVAEYLDFLH